MLPKIREAARAAEGTPLVLQLDGGISRDTIERAAEAGATCFVAGSAVYGAPHPDEEIGVLRRLAAQAHG